MLDQYHQAILKATLKETATVIPDPVSRHCKILKLTLSHLKLMDISDHQVHQTSYLFGPRQGGRTTTKHEINNVRKTSCLHDQSL